MIIGVCERALNYVLCGVAMAMFSIIESVRIELSPARADGGTLHTRLRDFKIHALRRRVLKCIRVHFDSVSFP